MKSLGLINLFIFCASILFAQHPVNLRCEYLKNPLGIDVESPRFTWQIADNRMGARQETYQVILGTDSLAVLQGKGTLWNSGKIASKACLVPYRGRVPLLPFQKYYWRVETTDAFAENHVSAVSSFETGMRGLSHWKGAWISDGQDTGGRTKDEKPAPYFRKEFTVKKQILSARAYIAVGGLYELFVNGQRIGNHRLDPMFTRYDRRNLYVTYDLTKQLTTGPNAVGVLLGNGWYNHQSTAVWFFDRAPWRNRPTFCMDIRLTYTDGTIETIVTDKTWKTSLSPVVFNSIYTAEHYDARREQPGWDKSGFDDAKWAKAIIRSAPSSHIVSQQLHPIRNVEQIKPVQFKVIEKEHVYVVDFGRTIAGVTQLRLKGAAGTVVRVKHGELLDEKGQVDMHNIDIHYRPTDDTDPFQTDIYILKGGEEETFMPHFNYKGFRYAEITSTKPLDLKAAAICAWFMHSDVPVAGTFTCSNPLLNKIWEATNNSYLSNLFGYPTDCPQREKNGWTGDAHIAIETGLYNFDGITIYEKWMADHRDEQQANGTLPAIIPTSGWGYSWGNGLDWTSTIAIIPWQIYLYYGDIRLLTDCYEPIKRYVDHVTDLYPSGLTTWGLGDWVPVKSKTPVEFSSSIYYYVDATILAHTAKLLHKKADYETYTALAKKIKETINAHYLDAETGLYVAGTQTQLSMPLYWGIVPEQLKAKVAANLAQRVREDKGHLDVGLLGSKSILNALSENGYADLAYTIASQKTYPSWGYWMTKGATTLYEDWKDDSKDASLNHIMFGEISAWFYKALGGIKPDPKQPGFEHILLQPNFVEALQAASATHQSPYGQLVSKWKRTGKTVIYTIVIPANTTATLSVPKGYHLKKMSEVNYTLCPLTPEANQYDLLAGKYQCEFVKLKNKL